MQKSILFIPRLLSLVVFSLLLMQCKKDEAPPKTPSELMLGSWGLTAQTISPGFDFGNGIVVTDVFAILEACDKDDITIFKTNSEGEFNEGPSKCDPQYDQVTPFIWTLRSNNTILSIDGEDFNIIQLDNTTLKITYTLVDSGVTYTQTITFTKK